MCWTQLKGPLILGEVCVGAMCLASLMLEHLSQDSPGSAKRRCLEPCAWDRLCSGWYRHNRVAYNILSLLPPPSDRDKRITYHFFGLISQNGVASYSLNRSRWYRVPLCFALILSICPNKLQNPPSQLWQFFWYQVCPIAAHNCNPVTLANAISSWSSSSLIWASSLDTGPCF